MTAVTYVIGYASVALFAGNFGVTVRDLGLDFRDHVLLAGMNLVAWTAWGGLSALGAELMRTSIAGVEKGVGAWLRMVAATLLVIVAVLALTAGTGGAPGPWTNGAALALGVLVLATILLRSLQSLLADSTRRHLTGMIGVGATLLVLVLPAVASWEWGHELRDSIHEDGTLPVYGPVALELLFQPTIGTVEDDGERACVVRLTHNILVGARSVVIREVDAFVTGRCDIDETPLTG